MFKPLTLVKGFVLDAIATAGFASGAIALLARGKLAVAILLAVCASAFLVRLVGRRPAKSVTVKVPLWVLALNLILSIAIAIALVEATQLPVRFDQDGFAYGHWALVLAVLVAGYALFDRLYRRLASRP